MPLIINFLFYCMKNVYNSYVNLHQQMQNNSVLYLPS